MSKNTDSDIEIEEYYKNVVVMNGGYGYSAHTVWAKKTSNVFSFIEHEYGCDEEIPGNIVLDSIEDVHLDCYKNSDVLCKKNHIFVIHSKMAPNRNIVWKEVRPKDSKTRRFRILWNDTFGNLKEVNYLWLWASPNMFENVPEHGYQKSSLKVNYKTKRLVFRIGISRNTPIKDDSIEIYIVNKQGDIIDFKNTNIESVITDNSPPIKVDESYDIFRAEILNPVKGYTYEARWRYEDNPNQLKKSFYKNVSRIVRNMPYY